MAFSRRPQTISLFKMVGVSLGIHVILIALLSLNPWPVILKAQPTIYAVNLVSVPLPEPEIPKPAPTPPSKEERPKPKEEKPKPIKKPKKDDIIEKVKKPPEKIEKPKEEKVSLKHLQEALEEIRKKVALEEIQKRVTLRERVEERPPVTPPITPPPTPSITSPKTSPRLESKLNEYYQKVWAKIKEEWTIPENLLKEMVDLETIIVLIIERDGKIQKLWFEKKSGDDLYDQMAMRAIKKADPLPPIPKEFSGDTLEIGIRFYPD